MKTKKALKPVASGLECIGWVREPVRPELSGKSCDNDSTHSLRGANHDSDNGNGAKHEINLCCVFSVNVQPTLEEVNSAYAGNTSSTDRRHPGNAGSASATSPRR